MKASSHRGSSNVDRYLLNYKLGRNLGHGSFGTVKVAEHASTGHKVAIKILNRQRMKEKEMEEKLIREIKILRLLMHPHIIRLYEVIETPTDICVVMEHARSGELFDYISEKGRLQEAEARHFFQQIISGVEYCHRSMVVHRDLKPENLLLDCKNNVKIADFGLSNIMRDGHFLSESCGSPNYAAPEVVSGKLYVGPEVDVWSCGVVLYALLCGILPFDGEPFPDLFKKIKGGIYTLPCHLSLDARNLIPRMLMVDPMKRITIPEIRQHPWFQAQLPRYLALPPPTASQQAKEIDEEILQKVVGMGFERNQVIVSLHNRIQNEPNGPSSQLVGNYLPGYMDYHGMRLQSQTLVDRKWSIGLQSQAHPGEILTEVLKALQALKARWKKIGHYNIKCMWIPGMVNDPVHNNHFAENGQTVIQNNGIINSPNVVKFELQLYKTDDGNYLLDTQRVQGPQFLFFELCAAFLTQLRVL